MIRGVADRLSTNTAVPVNPDHFFAALTLSTRMTIRAGSMPLRHCIGKTFHIQEELNEK
jgi:hypothetical protein